MEEEEEWRRRRIINPQKTVRPNKQDQQSCGIRDEYNKINCISTI
jgi:hypothetical protein